MDTSKKYIKMCDCPEIQKKWQRLMGDWIWDSHWKQAEVLRYDTTKKITNEWRDDYIWLPRQDQIQEMMLDDGDYVQWALGIDEDESPFELLFYRIMDNLPRSKFSSGEQLWLAFYIFENHQKIWGKDEWERVNNIE